MQRNILPRRGDSFKRSWKRPLQRKLSVGPHALFLVPTLLGALLGPISNAYATSLFRWDNRHENPGTLRLIPEYTSLTTTENYDSTGAKAIVPGLNSYKKTGLDIWGVYGINAKLSAFARLSMASVNFQTTTQNGNGSGLTEQGLGVNYRLWDDSSAASSSTDRHASIDGQFQLDIPFYDNVSLRTASPRQPLRGDGTLDMTLGAFGTLPLNQGSGQRLFGILGGGYTIRNNNYSSAMPYQLQIVGLPEVDGFLYRFGIHGFKSLTTDPTTGTAISPQAVGTGTPPVDPQDAGRSLIVDALNSSYTIARATAGYQWGSGNQLYASYVMPLSGASTAVLKGFVIGAQFRLSTGNTGGGNSGNGSTSSSGSKTTVASYNLEARVKQSNDRLNLVKIDRGSNDGIAKGDVFDIYRVNSDATAADLIARGVVTGVSESESVVNVRQYKKEVWIQPGYVARRLPSQKTP